jgi:hypothetical protein
MQRIAESFLLSGVASCFGQQPWNKGVWIRSFPGEDVPIHWAGSLPENNSYAPRIGYSALLQIRQPATTGSCEKIRLCLSKAVLNRQTMTPLGTACIDDCAPTTGFHTNEETVSTLATSN